MTPTGVFRLTDDEKADRLALPRVETEWGGVYLTFDDGPVPEVTPWVLDVLDFYGVKATFFMVGENALRYPELVEEVTARGHRVASHAHRHRPGFKQTTRTYLRDARKAHEAIRANSRRKTDAAGCPIFRPPHGFISLPQLFALKLYGYEVVLFDIVSRDYDRTLSADQVVDNVLDNVRDGSVIVFHDSIKAFPRLEKALPRILDRLCIPKNVSYPG